MTDAEFIRDPEQWPLWPVLPMKRNSNTLAYLLGDPPETGPITLWLGNFRGPAAHGEHSMEYSSVEAMLAAGWRVD